ncbi:hypothetical protein ACS0TY_030359 [Phlomoides rotata]
MSIVDLENLDVRLENEDKALMLLNALPKSLEHFKDTLLFRRQGSMPFEDVHIALKTKSLDNSLGEKKSQKDGENLIVKFKTRKKKNQIKKGGRKLKQEDQKRTEDQNTVISQKMKTQGGGKKMKVKKGWLAVQVGLANANDDQIQDYFAFQRFLIPISYLYNPLFQRLLDEASEIYDYQSSGPLMLPCSIEDFLRLRWRIENVKFN